MTKKNPQTCWECINCPKKIKVNCDVYKTNSGNECWLLVDIEKGCEAAKKYGGCFKCPVYKKLCSDS